MDNYDWLRLEVGKQWLWVKSCPPAVYLKGLLEHNHSLLLHTIHGYFSIKQQCSVVANRDHKAHKSSDIYYLAFYRKILPTPGLDNMGRFGAESSPLNHDATTR